MRGVTAQTGVKQTDIHKPRLGGRVAGSEVVSDGAGGEALAVDGDADVLEGHGLRPRGRQQPDALRPAQRLCDHAGGVVVAPDHYNRDVGLAQAPKLADHIQAGVVIGPVSVDDVTGDQQQVGVLVQAQIDKRAQRRPGRSAHRLDRRPWVRRQSPHRAIEVNIGSVNESHADRQASRARRTERAAGESRCSFEGPTERG